LSPDGFNLFVSRPLSIVIFTVILAILGFMHAHETSDIINIMI